MAAHDPNRPSAVTSPPQAPPAPLRVPSEPERGAFVEAHARLIFGAIQRALLAVGCRREPDLVEDLFAATFVAMFEDDARRLRLCQGRCSAETWLTHIATSVVRDWARAERRREARLDRDADVATASEGYEMPDDQTSELAALREALQSVSEADRELIQMLVLDERPASEVAERLGVTPGALYTRKSRALDKLKGVFDRIGRKAGLVAASDEGSGVRAAGGRR